MQLALPPVLRANGGGHRPNVAGRKPLRGIGAASYRQNRSEQFGSVGLLIVDRISVLQPTMRGKWSFLDADDCLHGQRSEERSVGKGWLSQCRSWWLAKNLKKK